MKRVLLLVALLLGMSVPSWAQDSQPPPQLAAVVTGDSNYTIYNNSQVDYIAAFSIELPNVVINRAFAPAGWVVEIYPPTWRPGRRATAVSWTTEDPGSMIPPNSSQSGFNLSPGSRRRAMSKYALGSINANMEDAGDTQFGKISAPSN